MARSKLALAPRCDSVIVRSAVNFTFFNQPFVHERIEIWIEPTMVNLCSSIVFNCRFDREAIRFVLPSNHIEEIPLEPGQIVHG